MILLPEETLNTDCLFSTKASAGVLRRSSLSGGKQKDLLTNSRSDYTILIPRGDERLSQKKT